MLLKKMIVAGLLLALLPWAYAEEDDSGSKLSRPMRNAIHFYEQGDDTRAMDSFMEILTKGDPGERSMANEYINLITHRMNSGAPAGISPTTLEPGAATVESVPIPAAVGENVPVLPARALPTARPSLRPAEMTAASKALMGQEIKARLRAAEARSLADLKAIDGVRVAMREDGNPEALGIPSALLFQAGISFRRDATRLLAPLTRLAFTLGGTQMLILPEGTVMGDAKILDMRRTMGISSLLYQAGVAPPRVRVNLLNTQVAIPKSLVDFSGIIIVFQYDRPMTLAVDGAVEGELGPPLSLGVFPPQIRPSRDQGAIIEFSVSDPPAGIVSWKFQLLEPSSNQEAVSLQEVVGGGPVFHQIFWNGRQNYFGDPLPAGRYECVLTALDGKNRRRALHQWIHLLGEESVPEKTPVSAAKVEDRTASRVSAEVQRTSAASPAAPSPDLVVSKKPLIKGVASIRLKPKKSKHKVMRRSARAKKHAKAKAARPAKAATSKLSSGPGIPPGHYRLAFDPGTHQMSPSSEKILAKVATEITSSGQATLQIIGHSADDEADGAALAERRAKMAAGLLINRYAVDPKRMMISSSSGGGAEVELVLVRSD